jgi:hypothetical protein
MEESSQLHALAALAPDTHCVLDWVDLRAGLHMVVKRKIHAFMLLGIGLLLSSP